MFKLVVLSALLAVAAARPGFLEHGGHSSLLYSAPATVIHEPAYASVGSLVKTIPTSYSHSSQSIVHSSAHVVQPIVAPIIKTTYSAPVLHAAPLLKTYAAAPAFHTSYVAAPHAYSAGWAPSW